MKTIDVRRGEWRSLAWAAGWFFCVLAAYYTIRPVRETFASELSRDHRANLFVGTLVVMLLATPIYGWVASRFVGRRLATCVYGFFCLNLIVFWALLSADNPAPWVGGAFFVWISVFNLFVVTLFWGTVVDLFTGEQGKRLFGVIASAGTFGQLVASWAVRGAAERLGAENLLWISCGLLAAAIVCAHQLWRDRPDPTPRLAADASGEATWSAAWEGALTVLRSPYLGGIALLLVGLSIAATSVYFQMTDLASEAIPNRDQRTAWFASINEWHGYLTLILQATAASYLLRTVGVAATLALTPLIYAGGFAALSITQALAVLAAFQVALRVASFAFGGPCVGGTLHRRGASPEIPREGIYRHRRQTHGRCSGRQTVRRIKSFRMGPDVDRLVAATCHPRPRRPVLRPGRRLPASRQDQKAASRPRRRVRPAARRGRRIEFIDRCRAPPRSA